MATSEPLASNGGAAIKVAVYAALVYDIVAATNSSPQTTEINAAKRGPTLMKWVYLGLAQAAAFVVAGAVLDPEHWPPLVGGGVAGVALWLQYRHALAAGTEGGGESTEDYLPWQNQ